jgi:hypothetical protein
MIFEPARVHQKECQGFSPWFKQGFSASLINENGHTSQRSHLQSPFKRGKLELNWSPFAAEDAATWVSWKSKVPAAGGSTFLILKTGL